MHLYVRPNRGHPTLSAAAGIVAKALSRKWQGSHQEVRLDNPTCHYLLFFDGGSRGNPGPGGSGAVVARLTHDGGPFQLVWAGTMSYAAPSTTNNVAENLGLLAGLTACQRHCYSPLHVVGDSAMILRQHAHRKPPNAPHLRPLYWRCRRRLAGVQLLSWQHHLRAWNKMADFLANMAMDSRTSTQTQLDQEKLDTPRWRPLVEHAGGDIGHWLLHNMDKGSTGDPAAAL
jgi:ribonuclease HI